MKVISDQESYSVSFHVFSGDAFARLSNPQTDAQDSLHAYRTRPFVHKPVHSSLAGEKVALDFETQEADTDDAYELDMKTWQRDSTGAFVPNLYHNMILPNADLMFNPAGDERAREQVNRLLYHVYDNLQLQDVALAHFRSSIISPFLHYNLRNKKV